MTANLKLVIIIPTKNRRALLERALQSVWAQSYQAYRILIVNDGSTDETRSYLETLHDPRLRVMHHTQSRGVNVARNAGFKTLQEGEWAVPLDDDDYFLPNAFETIADALTTLPSSISVVQFNTIFQVQGAEQFGGFEFQKEEVSHTFSYAEAMTGVGLRVCGEQRAAFKWTLFPEYLFAEDVNGLEGEWWMLIARDGIGVRFVKTLPIIFIDWQHEGDHLRDSAARRNPAAFLRANQRILKDHAAFFKHHPQIAIVRNVIIFKLAVRALDPLAMVGALYHIGAAFVRTILA